MRNKLPYTLHLYDSDDARNYVVKLWALEENAFEKALRFLAIEYGWMGTETILEMSSKKLRRVFSEVSVTSIARGYTKLETTEALVHEIEE